MTEINKMGWVFYDGDCALCTAQIIRWQPFLERYGFQSAPLNSVEANQFPTSTFVVDEMKVIAKDGRILGGADAIIYLARQARIGRVLTLMLDFPGMMPIMRFGYRMIAKNRRCFNGQCASYARKPCAFDWLPIALFPPVAITVTWNAPEWVMMWSVAVAIYGGCKWITFRKQRLGCPFRAAGYLLGWPGMDAKRFLDETTAPPFPKAFEWVMASAKLLFGIVLLWGGARMASEGWLQGWVGMVGIVFVLHFGLFHLLSLAWRTLGVCANPMMRLPVAARSLAEFWGDRWNRSFHDLAKQYLFSPFRRRLGGELALLLTFVASGLVHELVITLPARGGYGLPLTYFLIQGVALLVQKSVFGQRCLSGGWKGRVFTLLAVGAPAPLLFPPVFVDRVIFPFLHTIDAL